MQTLNLTGIKLYWKGIGNMLVWGSILLLNIFPHKTILSQNLYDLDHSKAYGQYLFDTRQYKLSAEEWERVLFMLPDSDTAKQMIIRSYLLGSDYSLAKSKVQQLFPDPVRMPGDFAADYTKSLILLDSVQSAESFLKQNRFLSQDDRLFLSFNIELLRDWGNAKLIFREEHTQLMVIEPRYSEIVEKMNGKSAKKPWLAGGMSMIIPGTGKIYAGEWKDGLISLFFVGATVFQSIRGYNLYGPKSGFFITYGSVATAFYLGNIYGSFRSAIRHNKQHENQIRDHIHSVFLDHL